VSHDIVVKSI